MLTQFIRLQLRLPN